MIILSEFIVGSIVGAVCGATIMFILLIDWFRND